MSHLGRYEIVRELESRGLSRRYAALDPASGRQVHISAIRATDHYTPDQLDAFRERLSHDVRTARGLSHPHLVALLDIGQELDLDYVVLQSEGGRTLAQVLAEETPPVAQSLRVLTEVARALDYLHHQGLVHDHVGPSSILVGDDFFVKLADFGIARMMYLDEWAPPQQQPPLAGVEYLSPEFLRNEQQRTGRSDQFSLAAVAFRLIAGCNPFAAEDLRSLMKKIILEEPAKPQCFDSGGGLQTYLILRKALSKDPSNRYDNCSRFVVELRRVCGGRHQLH
jgi:serine/threonine protein kinase